MFYQQYLDLTVKFCLSHVVAAADVFLSANPQWRHLPRFFLAPEVTMFEQEGGHPHY